MMRRILRAILGALGMVILVVLPGSAEEFLNVSALTVHSEAAELDQVSDLLPQVLALEPAERLPRASEAIPEQLEALARWNLGGRGPTRVGLHRFLGRAIPVVLDEAVWDRGSGPLAGGFLWTGPATAVWGVRLEVVGARGLRLGLKQVQLPPGTVFYVYGSDGRATRFGSELLRLDGDLWTPAVGGESFYLEIHVPVDALLQGNALRLEIDQVAEVFRLDEQGQPLDDSNEEAKAASGLEKTCGEEAACWSHPDPAFEGMKRATAYIETVTSEGIIQCSGTLLNDTLNSTIPYLLTADHCIGTQDQALSSTFYFDFIPETCGASDPSLFDLPRVHGATLLVSRSASGSSFLRLLAEPTGLRTYAGWTIVDPSVRSRLHSFNHPKGRSMRYSRALVSPLTRCGPSSSETLFSDQEFGTTEVGGSGSHVVDPNFRVVGQLVATCGADPSAGCQFDDGGRVDGRFSRLFPVIQPWLARTPGPSCTDSESWLCLRNGRFRVEGTWRDFEGNLGDFHAVPLSNDSGLFWFFHESNIEFLVKVLDGCGVNGHHWVFAAATTDIEYTLRVTDLSTSAVRTYFNRLGNSAAAITDTAAFDGCP